MMPHVEECHSRPSKKRKSFVPFFALIIFLARRVLLGKLNRAGGRGLIGSVWKDRTMNVEQGRRGSVFSGVC
jgi:hypothetical protein